MRLVADENFDAPLVNWLRSQGHDVSWVVEEAKGSEDLTILDRARRDSRIILTFDRDFGELVFRRRLPSTGVVLFRLRSRSAQSLLKRLQTVWPRIEEVARDNFIVVTNDRIRVRHI